MFDDIHAEADPTVWDAADPLAGFRARFSLDNAGVIYLDGNSLGRPPRSVQAAMRDIIDGQWPHSLIKGWDHWIDLPARAGDRLAGAALGARPGEVLVSDSTSVNLYKLAAAALAAAPPGRRVIVTDDDNFPTDRYVLQGVAEQYGGELRTVETDIDTGVDPQAVAEAVGGDTALVSLSHVAYRSGALADMTEITDVAHDAGALVLWDLCHSVGSVDVALRDCDVDLAVGCTYKHVNAGPGAPAFLYVREDLHDRLRQPIWGWFSQADQFDMDAGYRPQTGVGRFAVGTPGVVGVAGVLAATELIAEAGMPAIREKSMRLGEYAARLVAARLTPLGFTLASPADPLRRGGHLTVRHPQAWQISQAMREAGVIPDYRTPERIRLGFAPLYNGYTEVRDAIDRMAEIVSTEAHVAYPADPGRVT
ncbi:kynureninase [Stackebrandtia albiflava]|uniref:Kynureninase n=1 Tax=Stackebrandtia albiflava TaxID=406432 RepID=A0A562VAN6_9ACTN|nr:kynureninase [Stackebrandtia albiflava]TWJ14942.1 kynureninase [Stackebrandtia albiflava]